MDILDHLAGGDRRSIGAVPDVVRHVLKYTAELAVLIDGMANDDDVLRMRCADAAEKISATRPDLFMPFAERLLALAQTSTQQEVRWHLAQMLPRVGLTGSQKAHAITTLQGYLDDKSRIVKVSSMEALFDFTQQDPSLVPELPTILEHFAAKGSAAEQKRAQKLLHRLHQPPRPAP